MGGKWVHIVLSRDVNLPLFGGIPLFFFTFRFFQNYFPLFFENRKKKKKKKKIVLPTPPSYRAFK